jgi:hypothetical protein
VNNAYILLLDEEPREQTVFRGVFLSTDVLLMYLSVMIFIVYLLIEFIFMDNSIITREKT